MHKRLSLLLMFLISSCTFQVEVLNTPTPQPSETALPAASTSTAVIVTDPPATSPPFPTFTATNPAPPPLTAGNPGVTPIQFGPDGTYVDIIDSIPAGKSKIYSVNAMKGQVMSLSTKQNVGSDWTSVTMRIIGEDDSLLCAADCQFWRGVLPVTENYYVTLYAAGDAPDFTMRVAIDPPGTNTQSFLYENMYRNASLSYTDVFAPAFFPGQIASLIEPELKLQFIDTPMYTGTNLNEAYFLFGSSTDPQIVSKCTQPAPTGESETPIGDVTINGIPFTESKDSGVGAGNIYEQTYYRTVHNNTCYEITYYIHYGNIGNYDPGTTKEFDKAALLQRFDQTLSTLVLE